MNITIRFVFKRRIDTPPRGSIPVGFTQLRLVDETFEVLDDNFSVNIDNEKVNDFSKAIDSKFTKTLKVAGTQKAIDFFKEYYEVRYEGENDFSFIFNSRTGEHCIIYVDDVEVMQGVALLTGITKNKNLTIFEIQVINDVKDILNEFKNLYIDELDDYGYEWTFNNVKTLLNTTVNDPFIGVAMADGECVSQKNISGSYTTAIDISKIPIAANVKKILDKGFEKIGVQYQSNFLNSDRLKALWLCNNKSENLGIWGDSDKMLLDFFYNNVIMLDYLPFLLSDLTYTDENNENYRVYINKVDRNISRWDLMHGWSSFYGQAKYTSYEITINTSESDELDSYVNGATRHIYLVGNCKYRINFDLQNYAISGATNNKWRGHIIFRFTDLATNQTEVLNYYTDDFMNYNEVYSKNITFEKELEHNSILDIYVQEDIALHESYWDDENEKMFVIDSNCDSISINVTKIAGSHVRLQGSTINLYSQLPHISMYDVIVNLQKMFNLVFSLDKDTNKLVIEPEVDYYQLNSNTLLDITELVDYDSEISIEPASTLIDYNKISAKYNISDKDFHNSYCLSQYGRAFGELKTEFESYAKDELEIKNEFTLAKAAIYPFNDNYIFSASYENENGNLKKVSADKCFIGVRKVHTNNNNELLKIWYNENIHENYNHSQYNYLDFCSADFDYSYDTPRAVFTNMDTIPFDNLFFNYYYKVLQEYITLTGKVVRLKAYFDPLTFSSLSKKRIVYWQNNYWKLLKISDWSPKKSVVSVTLLKMIDVEVPKIAKKPIVVYDTWQFGGWIKPLMLDTDNVSVDFLDRLSKQGVMISNKAELVNVSEVNDNAAAVQELNDILYNRYIQDNVSKYDQVEHKIVECLLDDYTEIEFPDYSFFKGIYLFPVEFIEEFIFSNIIFIGNFKMDNLKIAGDYAFVRSNFSGSLNLPVCNFIGREAFVKSNFTGSLSLPACEYIDESAFYNSKFKTITIGANAELYANCIGAHSAEFIEDYKANGKRAGTYIWDGSHWIYQK